MFAKVGSILLEGHAYGHGEFVHYSAPWYIALCMHLQRCLLTSVTEIPAGELCLSPTWGTYDIGCQGRAAYPSSEGGVAEWFVVVGRQWRQGVSQAFQKPCLMSSIHWGYSSSWTSRHARGFSMFCVWGEEKSSYYVFMWSISTWLVYDMFEATLNFSTILTVELSSLSRIFGTWCFHQSYLMIMYGFHSVLLARVEYEELWLRDSIEREMVELIIWNLMAKH